MCGAKIFTQQLITHNYKKEINLMNIKNNPVLLYIVRVLVSIDQLINTVFGPALNLIFCIDGFGYPDETLSSVFGKYYGVCRLCRFVCRVLVFIGFGKKHCHKSIEADENINP